MKNHQIQRFPIPGNLHELEGEPYNLFPYPVGFDNDDDEAARADAFDNLVDQLIEGNQNLENGGFSVFDCDGEGEDYEVHDEWMDNGRQQNLYTLVRKSTSLAPHTRKRLVCTICDAISTLCEILSNRKSSSSLKDGDEAHNKENFDNSFVNVVPQNFRDALACHIYMLYNIMCFSESEAKSKKQNSSMKLKSRENKNHTRNSNSTTTEACSFDLTSLRKQSASTMLLVAEAIGTHKSTLWKCGVPDENVVTLPCRIAFQILESASTAQARKSVCADEALKMIATTVVSADFSSMSTIVAAVMDLLHSYEHISPLVAELCCLVSADRKDNRLAVQLLQEISRSDFGEGRNNESNAKGDTAGKASGVRNVAPFISHLALLKPRIVLDNMIHILPLLNSEPYMLRNSVVYAIGHIVARYPQKEEENDALDEKNDSSDNNDYKNQNTNKTRDNLLDVLIERTHDRSSYTRCAVLKVWAQLSESNSIPLDRLLSVTELAVDRLQDASVNVRSKAMKLLTLLIENNPFLESLDPIPYQDKVAEIHEILLEKIPSKVLEDTKEAAKTIDDGESKEIDEDQIKHTALAAAIEEANNSQGKDDLTEEEIDFQKKVGALRFMSSALAFIDVIEGAQKIYKGLLLSSNPSDVTEALRFFVKARHFDLPCAVQGIKDALALMWSTEQKIREEVLKGFVDVFIAVPGTNNEKENEIEFLPDKKIAHNLLVLVGEANMSELASIEEAIGCLVKEEKIPEKAFLILWNVASKAPGDARAAAMLILSMGAKMNPGIVDSASRLLLLHDAGLGEYAEDHNDWRTARSAAITLQQVPTNPRAPPGSAKALMLDQIIERLHIIIRGDWCKENDLDDTNGWFSACEQAINSIFVISEDPERVCGAIIRDMEGVTFGFGAGSPKSLCSVLLLSRFFFVIGHVALKLLVYTESLGSAVRRANAAKSLSKQESADNSRVSKGESPSVSKNTNDDDIENELGVAAEAEAETERKLDEICEKEIVGRGLIGLFSPLLLRVVANEDGNFSSDVLLQSATLTLCKFMAISASFCEKHLPLLFTCLNRAATSDDTLRANIVVALGDLAFRFPNAVEPYTTKIYACLRDKSEHVKRHTLMVLTHLILNDMVKVKGQVCEIALCLEDDEVKIRDLARLLFHELSKRSNNPIYNLLPDIISRLSQKDIPKETFRKIMSHLLCLIKKERQIESLVVKLAQRFPTCESITQKGDLAYCLANLPKLNEKCIKSLSDNFKLYKDALFDEDVFHSFAAILTKAEKFAKVDMKDILEEWREKLESENKTGLENHRAGSKAKRAQVRASRRAARKEKRKSNKPKRVSKKEYEGETDSDEQISEEESDNDFETEKENVIPSSTSYEMNKSTTRNTRSSRRLLSS